MSKKYQIFVSSTYQDLIQEREQVIKSILEMGHIPVGMEMFSAADEEQWKIISRQIDEIDYYVIIVAHRYGSTTPEGISFTEKEYDYAASKGVPILGFVIDESAPWPNDRHEKESKNKQRLQNFKSKIKSRLVHFWSSKEELHGKVSISLMKAITANPRTGWIRANQIAGAEVINEISRLSSENAQLREQVATLKKNNEAQHDEVRDVIKILASNDRKLGARTKDNPNWDAVKYKNYTLADVFLWIGSYLISEDSSEAIGHHIAVKLVGADFYRNWPIGRNVISDLLADLSTLDLVEPSKKKHSVNDTKNYWTLTKLGKQVLKQYRRVSLEEGLSRAETSQEET